MRQTVICNLSKWRPLKDGAQGDCPPRPPQRPALNFHINNLSMNLALNHVFLTAPAQGLFICLINVKIFQQKPDSIKSYFDWHFDPKLLTLKLTSLIVDQLRMLKTTCSGQSFATTNTPFLLLILPQLLLDSPTGNISRSKLGRKLEKYFTLLTLVELWGTFIFVELCM